MSLRLRLRSPTACLTRTARSSVSSELGLQKLPSSRSDPHQSNPAKGLPSICALLRSAAISARLLRVEPLSPDCRCEAGCSHDVSLLVIRCEH